jgi:hypothetical protein
MMLSVLVWLAMQVQPPYNSVDCDPQMRNGKEYQQCAVDAPAEHVIEIKTVRVLPKGEDHCYVATTVPNSANDGKTKPCPPNVRELWIDGVRWGVVKGLE